MNYETNASIELIITTSHRVHETFGGVEKFVASFSSWCSSIGIDVTVVSRTLSVKGIKITRGPVFTKTNGKIEYVKKIHLSPQLYYLGLGVFSFFTFLALLRLIKTSRIRGSKLIALHSQDINFAALATVLSGKLLRVPTVVHQHGPYQELLPSKSMKIIEQSINKITCRFSDLIIATDAYTAVYLKKIISDDAKICVIPAAVSIHLYETPEKKVFSNNYCFRIGYIGRFSTEKNLELLLQAFKEFRLSANVPSKLVLVGDGKLRDTLKQLASSLKIAADVEFVGFQTDIAPFLSALDVSVLPSKVEGTPMSLIEAMAAGKAIVASKIPPIQAIVNDGKEALLFNPDSSAELKDKLLALYNNSELRRKLGSNARSKSKQYDVDVVFSEILQEYEKLNPSNYSQHRNFGSFKSTGLATPI